MQENIPQEAIDKIVDEMVSSILNCTWQATTEEEALEEAFQQPQVIAMCGNLSLNTTLEEVAFRFSAIDNANKILADKESASPQKEVFYSFWAKDYAKHIESWKSLPKDSAEYQATVAYDSVCKGLKPTIEWFASVLVNKRVVDWDADRRKNILRYGVKSALDLKSLLNTVTYGYVIAHKIGELQERKSFKNMLQTKVAATSQLPESENIPTWYYTVEEAVITGLQYPEVVQAYGNLTLDTPIREIANKGAIQYGDEALAKKEQKILNNMRGDTSEAFSELAKDYREHVAYLEGCKPGTAEYGAAKVYNLLLKGTEPVPTIKYFLTELTTRSNVFDGKSEKFIIGHSIPSAPVFKHLLDTVASGCVYAALIGQLRTGKSFQDNLPSNLETSLPSQQVKMVLDKNRTEHCYSLQELIDPKYLGNIGLFFNLLIEIDKPAINEDFVYIGKDKGVVSVWFNCLEYKGIVKTSKNDIERSQILNSIFKGYNVSESHFRTDRLRAKEKFDKHFKSEISAIKVLKSSQG